MAHKVFSTYETLECLLSKTSATDLARARAVNSFWKGVIDRSATLQEKLFLMPTSIRPVLERIMEPSAEEWRLLITNDAAIVSNDIRTVNIIQLHPLMRPYPLGSRSSVDFTLDALRLLRLPDAPWKGMFISQPPVVEMEFSCSFEYGVIHRGLAQDDDGVKFSTVFEALYGALKSYNWYASCGHFDGDGCEGLLRLLRYSDSDSEDEYEILFGVSREERRRGEHRSAMGDDVELRWKDETAMLAEVTFKRLHCTIKDAVLNDSPYVAEARGKVG